MMSHKNRSGNPKSQTRAFETFGCKEWIEKLISDFLRDARSAIMNGNSRAFPIAAMSGPDSNNNIRSRGRSFSCISNQIAEDLGQLSWKSTDGYRTIRRAGNPDAPLRGRPLRKRRDFGDKFTDIDWDRLLRIPMKG